MRNVNMRQLIARDNSCCFSGYRPEKLPWGTNELDERCIALKKELAAKLTEIYAAGIRHFICGMARGSDTYFCEGVLALRRTCGDVTLEAAIPCEEQAAKWPEADRFRYFKLLSECDFETYVSRKYTRDCMTKRNRYMVDKSGILLTVYDGKFGGTMHTIGYAAKRGLQIIKLTPWEEA